MFTPNCLSILTIVRWKRKLSKKSALILLLIGIIASLPTLANSGGMITQISPMEVFPKAAFDGYVSLDQLLSYGNFGIGTFHTFDGEMILLDGKIYQVKHDGKVYYPPLSSKTFYALIGNFKERTTVNIDKGIDMAGFEKILSNSTVDKSLFWAIKMKGRFTSIKLRSVPAQSKPYRPLSEVLKTQVIFDLENVSGTVVGFWTPDSMKGVSPPGYHFHFITKDFSSGGHILAFAPATETAAEMDTFNRFHLILSERD